MHFINLPNLAFLALSYLALDVVADSGYAASCNSINYSSADDHNPHWEIVANCREISGIYNVDTVIGMDLCFANAFGNLVGQSK